MKFSVKGHSAFVDRQDSDLAALTWYIHADRYLAHRRNGGIRFMHRKIVERMLERNLSKGEYVDHINGNGLDNRRKNLRAVSHAENLRNRRGPNKNGASGYRGVTLHRDGVWVGQVMKDGRNHYCGSFRTPLAAARAASRKRKELGFV